MCYNVVSILNISIQNLYSEQFMKVAVVGSRGLTVADIGKYIADANEIVSGGAKGIDALAARYAEKAHLKLTIFLPCYRRYGRAAPIIRNQQIVDYADRIVAFWDGVSRGTLSVIRYAEKVGKPCKVILCKQ